MIRAVLDANVYVSAAIRPEGPPGQLIERLLKETAFELVVTPTIIEETNRALHYPGVRRYFHDLSAALDWLDDIILLADVVEDRDRGPMITEDPDDDKYLHAAVTGQASVVVTGDHHLLELGEYEGILIATPKAFLELLGG
jgi:putative PIN family toxin of toxin-antitoxin system